VCWIYFPVSLSLSTLWASTAKRML
jgi:hypothetical protein